MSLKSTWTSRLPAWLVGSGVIAVAMGVMNVGTYAFTMIAARLLGPRDYGALAAVMGLLLVLSVLALALQATAARRVAAAPGDLSEIESQILVASYRSALVLAAVTLLLVPVVTHVLRLDTWVTAVLVAATVVPMTVMGGQAGVLQGERRWHALAAIYLALGLGRLLFGVVAMLLRPDPVGAMIGVAVGAVVPAVIGHLALRHPSRRAASPVIPVQQASDRGVLHELGHSSHALLAFFALSNADVLIARGALDDRQSGLYAAGLILAKAVLFLPQFVTVLAFPAMSSPQARGSTHLKALGMVLGIGALATLAAWLLSPLAIAFVGGREYAAVEPVLWLFSAIGTLLAMIHLMVYNVLARQHRRSVVVVWTGLAVLVAIGVLAGSPTFLAVVVTSVLAAVLVVLFLLSLRGSRPFDGAGRWPAFSGRRRAS
ncbi:MAG TPA: hypothetical protein VJ794_04835 [Gemmatimonadales bacterium]|nr:hypothetical protein [Gemmatimonadales bacterium]